MKTFLDILKNRLQHSLLNAKPQIAQQSHDKIASTNSEFPEINQSDSANIPIIKSNINSNEETQGQVDNTAEHHNHYTQQNSSQENPTNDKQALKSDRGNIQPGPNKGESIKQLSRTQAQNSKQPINTTDAIPIGSLPNLNLSVLAKKIITQTVNKSKQLKNSSQLEHGRVQTGKTVNGCNVGSLKGILRNGPQKQKDIAVVETIQIQQQIINSINQSQKQRKELDNNKIRKNSTETVPKVSSTLVESIQKPTVQLNKAKTIKFAYPKQVETQKPVYFNPALIPNQKQAQPHNNTTPSPKSQDIILQQSKAMINAFKKLTEPKESKSKEIIQISSSSSSSSSSDSQSSEAKKSKEQKKKNRANLNLKQISEIMMGRVEGRDNFDKYKNRSHTIEIKDKISLLKPDTSKANLLDQIKQKLQSYSAKSAKEGIKKSKKNKPQKACVKIALNSSKQSDEAISKSQADALPSIQEAPRSPWFRLQPNKRDVDDKSPIHKLYQLDELKDVAFTVDVKLLAMEEEDNKAIAKKIGLGVFTKKTGPENAAKNTYYALKSILKDSPSSPATALHRTTNASNTLSLPPPATSLYSTFVQRRMHSPSKPIDLGVLSLDEVVEHCFNKRIISEELYTEYVSFSSQEKILQFLRLFTENRIDQWNFKQLKITLLDHRRLSQWLVHLYPKEYTIGAPMALNHEVSVFLTSMYELSEREYKTMLNMIDELSNLSLWRTLKIKYPKTQVKAEEYPPLEQSTIPFSSFGLSNEISRKRAYVSPNLVKKQGSTYSSQQLQRVGRLPGKKRII